MKIKVDVNNVTIIEKSDIHKGEYNINKCVFEFSSEYTKDLIYRAVFSCINGSYYQLILNNECNIPEEILREKDVNIELGVYAYILNDDNELELRYSPKPTYFRVENGSYKDADKTQVPSPTDYEKFLNEFNRNANEKTEEFNKNYENKVNSFNNNATQKINEYNKNADERVKEINNKVSDIEKIEENIEQIQKNIQASEQNAKTSETNAKTSESNAQKSAENASEVLTNVTTIQEDINKSKVEINTAKESVDKSVEKVYSAVTEATNQAKESKKQAGIATSKANQTSEDRTVVETMKSDVSSMKTSVEQTKTDTEQIKNDTQAIKNDTEALKEETLQAKEEVENSLENERIESDKKYARAIDSDVINVDNFGQVEVDDDGYMKDIEIESTLPEIAQDTREGYNKFNIDTVLTGGIEIETGKILANDSWKVSEYIEVKELTEYLFSWQSDSNFFQISYAFYDENKNFISASKYEKHNIYSFIIETAENIKYIRIAYSVRVNSIDVNRDNIQLIEGTDEKEYERYGASPSLDYPSEFKNMLSSFNIKNTVDKIEKYNKQITLPENKFLGTFNGYKNYIKDNKLKSNLKIVEFTETLDWNYHDPENKFMCSIPSNAKIKDISLTQLCSHYKTKSAFASNENEFACTANGFRFHNDNNMSLEEWKNFLTQQKEAGTPLQILYIASDEETELEEINLPLYKGINNIFAEDLKVSFKYNVSIEKYIKNNNITERKISDNKYARALKTQLEDIEQIQVYAENDEVEDLTIKGAPLTQKTREGYNEIQNEVETSSMGGIDITRNSDESVTLNGTATENITLYYSTKSITLNGKYIFYLIGKNSNINLQGIEDGSTMAYLTYASSSNYIERSYEADTVLSSFFSYIAIGKTFNNETYYPMITKGEEVKPYEEYGASPSLDYPSEIQVAKEQNISIERKNKCRGWMNTTSTAVYGNAFLIKADLKPNTKYTISFLTPTFEAEYYRAEELTSNWFTVINNGKRQSYTFTTKADISNAYKEYNGEYGYILFKNAIATPSPANFSDVMLVEGDTDVPYEPYYGYNISIALENGFNGALKDYYNEIKKLDGKWYLVNKFARYVLDGVTVGKKVTAKQSKNNIDKYDVMLGTDKIYINTSKDYWKPTLGICNYLKSDKTYGTISDINSTYTNAIGFWKSGQDQMSFSTEKDRFASIDEANAYLKQLYDAGNPLEFYALMSEDNYETIELPEEVKQELDKFKLYDDLNNIFIGNGTLSFKYNKSLLRAFEEQSELSASLLDRIQALEAAQVNSVGGN